MMTETELLALFNQGQFSDCESAARALIEQQANQGFAWKVLGVLLKQQGRHIQALEAMQTAAELLADDAEAHSNLGVLLMNQGLLHDAVDSYHRALALNPQLVEVQHLLGLTLSTLGRIDEAEACYQRVLQLNADYVDAYYHLGRIYQQQGRLSDAELCYRRVLQTHADLSEVHSNLAWLLYWQGHHQEAEQYYRNALSIHADDAQTQGRLGLLLQTQGRFSEAKQCYENALSLNPQFAELYNNLGIVCHELGLADQAQAAYQQAISLNAEFFEAYNNLGLSLQNQGRYAEAETAYRAAMRINPKHSETHHQLGIIFQATGQLIAAKASYQKALAIEPHNVNVLYHLAELYQDLGQLSQAEQYFAQVLSVDAHHLAAHSRLLVLMNQRGENCLDFALSYAQKINVQPFTHWLSQSQPERLRLGMVIGDLHHRAVGRFLAALLPELDSSCLELVIYNISRQDEEHLSSLKPYCAAWHDLMAVTDQEAAQLIHQHGIHLLFDLVGHSPNNRLPIFAWQAAPIQVNWLGALMTTGLSSMTYILGDSAVTPHAAQFSETIWPLPDSYRCFTEPLVYLETDALPALTEPLFTFACFQPLSAIHDDCITLWANLLHQIPDAQLYLKNAQLNDPAHCQWLRQQFAELGVLPERLLLEGSSTLVERLAAYRYVDIALDTFPETGHGTIEALWMGVPVLTQCGSSFLSRCGAGILHHVDLTQWVAKDEEDFIAKAVYFSADLETLVKLRAQLRQQLLNSALLDVSDFARNFEAAVWSMYTSES